MIEIKPTKAVLLSLFAVTFGLDEINPQFTENDLKMFQLYIRFECVPMCRLECIYMIVL